MSRNRQSPTAQAQAEYQQRGTYPVPGGQGFVSNQWNTHPNDRYLRVFPDGPYNQEWAGVQKMNAVAGVGLRRASMYGSMTENPLQTNQWHYPRINLNNRAGHSIGAGPAVLNGASWQAQAYMGQEQAPQAGLLSTILSKLRGS